MATDRELLKRYVEDGAQEAFRELVDRHAGCVHRTCLRILGDSQAAEDATQAVFLVLMRKARRLPGGKSLEYWLFWTARNCALQLKRAQQRRARHEQEAAMAKVDTAGATLDSTAREVAPHLDAAIASLPRRQQQVLVLRFFYSKTQAEIAEQMGRPQRTVASQLASALNKLRQKLAASGAHLSVGALSAVLAAEAAAPVPAGLAASVGTTCLNSAPSSQIAVSVAGKAMKAMMWTKIKVVGTVLATVSLVGGGAVLGVTRLSAGRLAATPAAAEPKTTILGTGSYWRVFTMARQGLIPLRLLKEKKPNATEPQAHGPDTTTAPPPAGWTAPDFDDSSWFRAPGPPRCDALTCIRGQFKVTNPGGVGKLTLSMTFTGGVIVYLNGKEVHRAHLPKGKITPSTDAEAYPKEAYAKAKTKTKDRRLRRIGPLELPVKLLRKGVNVLAVELHCSAFRPEVLGRTWKRDRRSRWNHVALQSLRLAADGDGAIVANVARPDGVQVWNTDPHRIFSVWEYGDPNDKLRPVRVVGARNGLYSGVVVLGSTAAISGAKATVSDLRASGSGTGSIPAKSVRVRYAQPITLGISGDLSGTGLPGWNRVPAYAALSDQPPAQVEPTGIKTGRSDARTPLGLPAKVAPAALLPVWVTVNIPKDAPAGKYAGVLSISATGIPTAKVPVEVEVIDWELPEVRDLRTFISLYQSPESVAVQYGVPMWSEKHWKLMEKSFELLGRGGNKLVVVPLVNHTQFGNDECMIPWIKKAGGGYEYDFKAYDRYMKLAAKHFSIKVVSYQVYLSQGWTAPGPDKPTYVTVVDPKTSKREAMKLPAYGTPEAEKLWKPLVAALKERHEAQKLPKETVVVLGITQDGGVHKGVAGFFAKVWPEVSWHYGAHNRPRAKRARGKPFGFSEYLYVPSTIPSPAKERRYGWRNKPLVVTCIRRNDRRQPPMALRTKGERALLLGDNGAGRMNLDYWPVKGSTAYSGVVVNLFDRWPESKCGQRQPQLTYLSVPGKHGALSTIRLEALREGLQESEARILVEKALVNKTITGALAAKAQKLLDARANFCRIVHSDMRPLTCTYGPGWRQSSANLYRLAAEVAAKLGK